jgi:hypothetical protein
MKIKYTDIEMAFGFVSSGPPEQNYALLDKETGKIYYDSDLSGIYEIPKHIDSSLERYVTIPHKIDLGLDQHLPLLFCEKHLEDNLMEVYGYFQYKGAYRKFKDLLRSKGLLEKWYEFENDYEKSTILEWCKEKNIEILA